jgi:chloramphenicol 3-O phosphotransferase
MKKQIILLNGPSSSGKSTLARALQARIADQRNERYAIVSIDDFMKLSQEETIYEDDVFDISGDMCEQVLQDLRVCDGVIIDHVITSQRIFCQLNQMLQGYPLCLIHVTCPLEVLRKREIQRHNRCLGSAEASYTYLFPKDGYDLTVDTHEITTNKCAARIFEAFFP